MPDAHVNIIRTKKRQWIELYTTFEEYSISVNEHCLQVSKKPSYPTTEVFFHRIADDYDRSQFRLSDFIPFKFDNEPYNLIYQNPTQ